MSTPYMNLDLPVPTVTNGPEWAESVNTAFETVDSHDHSTGKGTPIPASAITIDQDIDYNANGITDAKTVRMSDQVAVLSGPDDIRNIYAVGGDLYYNNGQGTPIQMTSGTSISTPSSPLVPSGLISMYGGATAPSGYLLCDGSAVSRVTYSDLFAALGTTYGVGDGSTTFNVPNMNGRAPIGAGTYTDSVDGVTTRTLNDSGGAASHVLIANEMPVHNHSISFTMGNDSAASTWVSTAANAVFGTVTPTQTMTNAGGGLKHNNMQPYLTVNFIIKT